MHDPQHDPQHDLRHQPDPRPSPRRRFRGWAAAGTTLITAALVAVTAVAYAGTGTSAGTGSSTGGAQTARLAAAAAVPAPPAGFNLTWSDEFNAAAGTGINTGNWKYDTGPGSSFGTGEIETMTNSTANVFHDGNGHLVLRALHSGTDPRAGWTSGRIETQAATYGAEAGGVVRMESSIQQPNVTTANGAGYWPAFWMLGSTLRTGTTWPTSGEIDILEDINGRSSTFGTLHCGVNPGGPCNESTGLGSGERPCPGCQTGYHTYAVEIDRSKSPEEIRWYLDDALYFTLPATRVDATTWANAVHHPFFIIYDLAMGGGFPDAFGGGPNAATISGGQMNIDWVAVYNKGPGTTEPPTSNVALGKPTTASSTENAANCAACATDGKLNTRWSSAFSDPQWLQVDLGQSYHVTNVALNWEAAYGKAYKIQVSNDQVTWADVAQTTTGDGGTDVYNVDATGRYVRMYGTQRGTAYGYSLWEMSVSGTPSGTTGGALVSQGKPTTASSAENAGTGAGNATDGNTGTRWSSAFSDPQWVQVDLLSGITVSKVVLNWEAAYAKAFQVQTSNDGTTWTTIYSTTTGTGGVQTLNVSGIGRYVRVLGTQRATAYGYSLWEFQVYGAACCPP